MASPPPSYQETLLMAQQQAALAALQQQAQRLHDAIFAMRAEIAANLSLVDALLNLVYDD
tara:strand:+ start:80 stop:259 length:180 start_codon:yes stop_codon:yes gene_type:complete